MARMSTAGVPHSGECSVERAPFAQLRGPCIAEERACLPSLVPMPAPTRQYATNRLLGGALTAACICGQARDVIWSTAAGAEQSVAGLRPRDSVIKCKALTVGVG